MRKEIAATKIGDLCCVVGTRATEFLLNFVSVSFPLRTGEHGIRSNYASLTVLVSPDSPKILQGDFIVTTEDHEIELECVSANGKPAAEVCMACVGHSAIRTQRQR